MPIVAPSAHSLVWHAVRYKNKCTLRRRVILYTTACIIIRRRVVFIQEIGLGLGLGARILLTFLHYTSVPYVGVLLYAVVYNYYTTTYHEIFLKRMACHTLEKPAAR